MPLGAEINLGLGDVVLDGVAVPPPPLPVKDAQRLSFRSMSVRSVSRLSHEFRPDWRKFRLIFGGGGLTKIRPWLIFGLLDPTNEALSS